MGQARSKVLMLPSSLPTSSFTHPTHLSNQHCSILSFPLCLRQDFDELHAKLSPLGLMYFFSLCRVECIPTMPQYVSFGTNESGEAIFEYFSL